MRIAFMSSVVLLLILGGCSEAPDVDQTDNDLAIQLVGTDQNDTITGTDADELLVGKERIDNLDARGGNDVLHGGPAGDALMGGGGNDTYLFNVGDGGDILQDSAGSDDIVKFGKGITPNILTIAEESGSLRVIIGDPANKDQLLIHQWGVFDNYIERFVFEDGTELKVADIEDRIQGNRRPKLHNAIDDQIAVVNMPFRFAIPTNAFLDPEGEALRFSAKTALGNLLLEGWLRFDRQEQVFFGTPSEEDIGATEIELTARDSSSKYSRTIFTIRVVADE